MAVNNFPIGSGELAELMDEVGATAVPISVPPANRKKKRPFLLPSIFIIGILLGWLVLGWWLWPVEWINAEPQNLSPEFQRVYLGLVASDYSLTRDAGRVQQILEKWDETVLFDLLSDMIVGAQSPEERERLILLAQAMSLPDTELSLTDVFLGQTLVLVGIGASVLFLGAALLIIMVPAVQKQARKKRLQEENEQAILEEIREEMGEALTDEDIFVVGPTAPVGEQEREPTELERMVADAESEAEAEAKAEEAEAEKEAEEEKGDAPKPLDDEDDPYLILDDDDDEEGETGGDPIFDLFQEEDDTSQEIDRLANPLPPVLMEDVLELSQQVIAQFHEGVRHPVR